MESKFPKIVQIMPCTNGMRAAWKFDDKSVGTQSIDFFALFDDGDVKAMCMTREGYPICPDEDQNFTAYIFPAHLEQ